jgi:elongation factor P
MEVSLGSLSVRIGKPCISPVSVALPKRIIYETILPCKEEISQQDAYSGEEEDFMIAPNEVEKGLALDIKGEPYLVLERRYIIEAGKAKIRLKLRHLRTHALVERTVDEGHKLTMAPVERRSVIFMYWDGEWYHFKDLRTRDPDVADEIILPPETLGEASKYIVDDLQLDLLLLNGEPVAVDLSESVVMRVKDTETPKIGPTSHYKPATMEGPARMETGLVVRVPPFIAPGDWIRVNTANGEYSERV